MNLLKRTIALGILAGVVAFAGVAPYSPTPRAEAALPPVTGLGNTLSGFGGFISGVTPCVCDTIGMLLTVVGPFGGDFIFSFNDPPKISAGKFFLIGGPVLGGAKSGASCGTDISHGSCVDRKNGRIITVIGGIVQ